MESWKYWKSMIFSTVGRVPVCIFVACSVYLKWICLLRAYPNYKNWVMEAKLWWEVTTKLSIQDQFLYIQSGPKINSLRQTLIGFSQNSFLQFPQKILIFWKNCLTKIFSKKFVIKKVILIFGVRWPEIMMLEYEMVRTNAIWSPYPTKMLLHSSLYMSMQLPPLSTLNSTQKRYFTQAKAWEWGTGFCITLCSLYTAVTEIDQMGPLYKNATSLRPKPESGELVFASLYAHCT